MHVIHDPTHRGGDLLTIAFGSSAALWAIAYVGLAPALSTPPLIMAIIALAGLVLAGVALGRWTKRGITGGVKLGLLLGFINFLIIASLQTGETPADAILAGLAWIVGFTVVAIALCTLGAWIGARTATGEPPNVAWTSWFAAIVAISTLPLLISGGVVTGLEAGLAVYDWLTTFGYPMMFYPLAKMQEDVGVYAEHFHRLWGLLIGLSVIFLMVQLFRVDYRAWVRWLSVGVLLAVIVQGILGGTRVTEENLPLAIVHGVFGQIVFATLAIIAACSSLAWLSNREPIPSERASGDRKMTIALIVLILLQIGLGALYRHLHRDAGDPMHGIHAMYTHIFLAFVVAFKAVFIGARAWSLGTRQDADSRNVSATPVPALPRIGKWLVILVGLQLIFGFAALVAVLARDPDVISGIEITLTTVHQVTGALILALAALAAVWYWRLFTLGPAVRSSQTPTAS